MFIENTLSQKRFSSRELPSMVMDLSEQKFDTGNGTQISMFTVDKFDVSNKTVKWEKDGKKFTSKLEGYSVATRMDQLIEDLS